MIDPIFKAATRPAMFLGVPTKPFIVSASAWIVGFYLIRMFGIEFKSLHLLGGLVVCFSIVKVLSSKDDRFLEILISKLSFLIKQKNLFLHKASVYNPIPFKKR